MKTRLFYAGNSLDVEVPQERLAGLHMGPDDLSARELEERIGDQLDHPLDYPGLGDMVVAGDRVAVALDRETPAWPLILQAIQHRLTSAGVNPESTQVVTRDELSEAERGRLPPGVATVVHDPASRQKLAYLCSTQSGTRVYLNREIVDADVVLAIGRIGVDARLGVRGPWNVIYPDLGDKGLESAGIEKSEKPWKGSEAQEVSWQLGCRLQVGAIAGATGGASDVIAGDQKSLEREGEARVRALWTHEIAESADVVVATVGGSHVAMGWDGFASALNAARLAVRAGGKIVLLTSLGMPLGSAVQRIKSSDDARATGVNLRGAEREPDYEAALALSRTLAWADIFLWSAWPAELVEDLSMVALGRPEDARRIAATAASCTLLNRADEVILQGADE